MQRIEEWNNICAVNFDIILFPLSFFAKQKQKIIRTKDFLGRGGLWMRSYIHLSDSISIKEFIIERRAKTRKCNLN